METQLPPVPSTSTENVKLLAIFSFILAGLGALGTLFILFHYLIMSSVMNNDQIWQKAMANQPANAPRVDPRQFFAIFKYIYLLIGLWGLLSVALNIAAGFSLLKRRNWLLCVIVSGFNLINIPFGTVLGIFAIVVLVKDSEKAKFS